MIFTNLVLPKLNSKLLFVFMFFYKPFLQLVIDLLSRVTSLIVLEIWDCPTVTRICDREMTDRVEFEEMGLIGSCQVMFERFANFCQT